jgi:hypothetical protein
MPEYVHASYGAARAHTGALEHRCAIGCTNGSVHVEGGSCGEDCVETVERRPNTVQIIDWTNVEGAKAVAAWARHAQRCWLLSHQSGEIAVKAFRQHRRVCIIRHQALGNIAFKVDVDHQALGLTIWHRATEHGIAHGLGDMHHLDVSVVDAGAGLPPAVFQLGVQKACANGPRSTGMLQESPHDAYVPQEGKGTSVQVQICTLKHEQARTQASHMSCYDRPVAQTLPHSLTEWITLGRIICVRT